MQDLKEYQKQIITRFDHISKKYEDRLYTTRTRDCLHQDLNNLYRYEVKPILGDDLGKKVFRESLIYYCGFAYGVSVFEDLFNEDPFDNKFKCVKGHIN